MKSGTPLARPLPIVNEMNRHFWCGGADGRLHILRCDECGYYIHPFGPTCPKCRSWNIKEVAPSGRGTVRAVTINYQPWFPHVPVPYAIVLVELEEQSNIRLMANLFNCPVDDAKAGMRVRVIFEQYGEIYVPSFEPA